MKKENAIYRNLKQGLAKAKVGMRFLAMAMMALCGMKMSLGQSFNGYYRFQNQNNNREYYMCPATLEWQSGKPFVTTYKETTENTKWQIVPSGNYYYIIHATTGKYLTLNPAVESDIDKKRVHLEATTSPTDDMLFEITANGAHYSIKPKNYTGPNYNNQPKSYLNPKSGNQPNYDGGTDGKGLIGFWIMNDNGSRWNIFDWLYPPQITADYTNQTVTLSSQDQGVSFYYTIDGSVPTANSTLYTGPINLANQYVTVKAIAYRNNSPSEPASLKVDFRNVVEITSLSEINETNGMNGKYKLVADIANASSHTTIEGFTGCFDGNFHTITGLTQPLFSTLDGGYVTNGIDFTEHQIAISNIILKDVNISGHEGTTGAIACTVKGNAIVYNCGILSGSVGGTDDTGGLVGTLDHYSYAPNAPKYCMARVINCYSFADITSAGDYAAGIVGNNMNGANTQNYPYTNFNQRTTVMNCMFYGDISGGTNKSPVYGNKILANNAANGINNYNYFDAEHATFDDNDNYTSVDDYKNSWPAEERFLTRFEYYRSILNSNRNLCTWYITGNQVADQTDADHALVAKWVLDPSVAKYPILKPWGKYPSVINQDPQRVWNTVTEQWVDREDAKAYQGKKLGTLTVTVDAGSNNSGHSTTVTLPVLDMDTLNHDYGYAKVQLPYYNELFGDPDATTHAAKYGNNYTDKVVTGWMITSVTGGTPGTFVEDWESGYDFADRYCTNKDLYSVSKRVFAQGGYYYVPEDVTAITIEAYWGKAIYLHNADHSLDRVNLGGNAFAPAGTLPATFNGQTVRTTIKNAIEQLDLEGNDAVTVYDQAIVLVGNYQYRNNGTEGDMGWSDENGSEAFSTHNRPYTFTSVDLDFDNEPDYCFEWQFSKGTTRLNLHPVRFDFLPVPALGMAIRTGAELQTIGVFAPRGHFEITETAFMHTGQFEYETRDNYRKKEAPLILNGGQFEQIVSSQTWNISNGPLNKTTYIILGGHVWMKEFTPGKHGDLNAATRHCAVSVLGGEYNRLCLSGVFVTNNQNEVSTDNPHCYINGGKFGAIYGAGMEQIKGNVTFKIDHSLIGEFYGGGLNAAKPITGNINVTINNSIVGKYCGGPFTGDMYENTSVTTIANNTVFGVFYGAGNGGTNYNRNRKSNASVASANITESWWRSSSNGKFDDFTPLHYVGLDAGYETQFEFELIDQSSSSEDKAICRTYCHEAQFTATEVRTVTSTLNNCEVLQDFYGAGNLGKVTGNVTSTLNNTTVWGSAYGGGYSAAVPSFAIHDKATVRFPHRDLARVNHPGSLDYVRDDGEIRYYKWIHDLPEGVSASTSNPTFQYNGEWYCYTEKDMTDLGSVGGNTILNINGGTVVQGQKKTVNGLVQTLTYEGAAFGGGNESPVFGNSTVTINGNANMKVSNVYGGGNIATTGKVVQGQHVGNSKVELVAANQGVIGIMTSGILAPNSGNVYGGGKGVTTNIGVGRVMGNAEVDIKSGQVLGNVYGGGELASVGYVDDDNTGVTTVSISGGTIGYDIQGQDPYEPNTPLADRVGNVFGGGKGMADERDPAIADHLLEFAKVNVALLTINGSAKVKGNAYGGGELGKVKDSTNVVIGGNAVVRRRAFAGGKGYMLSDNNNYKYAGDVGETDDPTTQDDERHGSARITLKDNAKVQVCLYGGCQIANVQGNAHVVLLGGQVGRRRTLTQIQAQPTHCYVFGSGQGNPANGNFNTWTNVDAAFVTIRPGCRVFGSVFGGGEDGHVLEDIFLDIQMGANDSIGTHGYSKVDGNIFSGGRGFNPVALTAGGTRGNIHTHIYGAGHILGSVFGGGRIASVGINLTSGLDPNEPAPGSSIEDTQERTYGHTNIIIEGNVIIGHDYVANAQDGHEYIVGNIGGNVYGGSMGDDVAPTTVAGQMSHVKQTEVIVRGNAWVKGSVNGGGESGAVWKDASVTITGNATIGVDRGNPDNPKTAAELEKLVYSGNVFGGSWGSDSKQYPEQGRVYGNTTVRIGGTCKVRNNIYGGGEYASVGTIDSQNKPVEGTGLCTVVMDGGELGPLDMSGINAYIFGGGKGIGDDPHNQYKKFGSVTNTHVEIKPGAHVYGSIFGGGEDGHVLGDALVDVTGGYLGTTGITTWDGNIFGGGRNYMAKHIATGRVGGNVTVNVTDVNMLGSIFGGGRLGSVGVDENGVMQEDVIDSQNPENNVYHGYVTVNVSGGTIGHGNAGIDDAHAHIGGNVYGAGKGIVVDPSVNPIAPTLAYSKMATVNISQAEGKQTYIRGSVFGGGEDGHVRDSAFVNISGGQIGGLEYDPSNPSMSTNRYHGNVYGGGRGLDQWEDGQGNLHYSTTAGKVYGNARVTITGGRICRSVYGGGSMASVGVESDNNTGITHVTVKGNAQIGTTRDAHGNSMYGGNVYGAGKGRAGSLYRDLTFVKRTRVEIDGNAKVHGSVFGGGEDGHVRQTAIVNIKGGVIGDSEATCQNKYHGNVYGAGRGIDETDDQSSTGYSWTAGRVNWNATINISGGHIYRNVYGGGNLASVGRVLRNANYEPVHLPNGDMIPLDQNDEPMYNTDGMPNTNFNPALLTGWAKVNITGGVIGSDQDEDDFHGNVFGSSHGRAGVLYQDLAYVHNTDVRVEPSAKDGEDPLIKGSLFGGGEDGHVTMNTKVTINGGQIGAKTGDQWKGNVYGGGRGIDLDASGNLSPTAGVVKGHTRVYINGGIISDNVFGGGNQSVVSEERVVNINGGVVKGDVYGGCKAVPAGRVHSGMKTVNVRNGVIWGNVYGCSHQSVDGDASITPSQQNPCWTAFVNISGSVIGQANNGKGNVHGAGWAGEVKGSTCISIGKNAIVNGTAPRIAANQYYNDCGGDEPGLQEGQTTIEPTVGTLIIRGSVYGGSDYYGGNTNQNDFGHYDATGYTNIIIDGSDYETRSLSESATNYMSIGGGIFGSSTHCESGRLGRNVLIKDYGKRTETGNVEMTSATRTLTTIQRCTDLVVFNSNVNLAGIADISGQGSRNYAVNKIFGVTNLNGTNQAVGGMYVSDASSLVLGSSESSAYMDQIKQLNSLHLKEGSIYNILNGNTMQWHWLGINEQNLDAHLYYIDGTTISGSALTKDQENVILFNGDSRLWVRYVDVDNIQKYGELRGFFRMKSPFEPYGTESFAYARPKITEGTDDNTSDGGFISYQTDYNFFTDGGATFTKTNQHPYTNVLQFTKGDRIEYREWVIREFKGRRWYVDGTRGWGRDDKSKTDQWGLFPDKPKKTISGAVAGSNLGGICTEVFNEAGQLSLNFDYEKDIIYVVGALSAADEANLLQGGTVGQGTEAKTYPLKLYRYPGGHPLSWSEGNQHEAFFDEGDGTLNPTTPNEGLTYPNKIGPGANYGAMLDVQANQTISLNNVQMDGLYGHNYGDDLYFLIPGNNYPNPSINPYPTQGPSNPNPGQPIENLTLNVPAFNHANVSKPMVVTHSGSTLTLNGSTMNGTGVAKQGTILERGYNNTDGSVWYANADYQAQTGVYHGGALYVDNGATVNVEGMVTVTDNKQNNGGTPIASNVYLPTFSKSLTITGTLAAGTNIGITSPIRNAQPNYTQNTLSPIAVANSNAVANAAWANCNFYDDLNWFFVNGHRADAPRSCYYDNANTLSFGWTWVNVVRANPGTASYEETNGGTTINIKDEKGLAWLISVVNGNNGQTASNMSGKDIALMGKDILDLQQYVWVPVGTQKTGSQPFSGTFDGRGHLITNLDIAYIGDGDRRYERVNYGLFGRANGAAINRTFVVSGYIAPVGTANIGGLAGTLEGANAMISNSEAAVEIHCPEKEGSIEATGGLVGIMRNGSIHSSMAMPTIYADRYNAIGGLVGKTDDAVQKSIRNSFANAKFVIASTSTSVLGGIVGVNKDANLDNCYSHLQDGCSGLNAANFALIVGRNDGGLISRSYGPVSDYQFTQVTQSGDDGVRECYQYTPVISSDNLGYMYADNRIVGSKADTTLFAKLTMNAWSMNKAANDSTYAHWARPALDGINGDLPVLLLDEFDGTSTYQGQFRSVATYVGGPALQYGGPVRDGNELNGALTRLAANDNMLVYGDIVNAPTDNPVAGSKVSVYEHATIKAAGSLANFGNTYVGISFDNSCGKDFSSPGINYGLMGMGGYLLPRDWHMFSSPLSNAPLGFDYVVNGTNTNTSGYTSGDHGDYFNNPWVNGSLEFSWLNGIASGNNRYWMAEGVDGYFPHSVDGTTVVRNDDLFIVSSDECPESGIYRYPYGMDLFTWTEPDYHWINFKRNGPNHWHSDANESTGHHDHLDYVPYAGATANQNEDNLIVGRGYMASITVPTFLESHGQLNSGAKSIALTNTAQSKLPGWNLVGNPYHGYLDFDQLARANDDVLDKQDGHSFYVVYDADQYETNAYVYYPMTGSNNGAYANQYLHPHQGFYVLAKGAGALQFNESMLVPRSSLRTDADGQFRDEWHPNYPLVNLYLSSEQGCADVTVIEFERPEWGGAKKLKELRVGNGVFYAQHDDTHYAALFAKAGTERVPLWFEAKDDDVFTIKWNTANGDFQQMYLVDNMTGVRYDMIEHDSYTFEGHKGDYPSRFYITFSVTDVEENDDANHGFAFFDGSQWVVTGEGQLEFVDMHGRVLWKKRVDGQGRVVLPQVAPSLYLLRLTNGRETRIQKIIINK